MLTSRAFRATSKHALALTLPLVTLIGLASVRALVTASFYEKETSDWAIQSTAQDLVDLFLMVPVLTLAGLYVHRGERLAEPIWGGSLLYLIYTYIIYCFNVHYNELFLVYISILGLSVWSFVYFINNQHRMPTVSKLNSFTAAKTIGVYLIAISALFYFIWLADIIGSLSKGEMPKSLVAAGLFTNPVHVLDLSCALPGIFITGMLVYRRQTLGLLFAPVVLVFLALMDITIGVIFIAQQSHGSTTNLPGALTMAALAVWTIVVLLWFLRTSSNTAYGEQRAPAGN